MIPVTSFLMSTSISNNFGLVEATFDCNNASDEHNALSSCQSQYYMGGCNNSNIGLEGTLLFGGKII
jgi:hypothetical protein